MHAPWHAAIIYDTPSAYSETTLVRSYEVGRSGRVQLGTLLRYLEYVASNASAFYGYHASWYEARGTAWLVRDIVLRLGTMPSIGERLHISTWVSSYGRIQAMREYAVVNQDTGQLLARAQTRWAYINRITGQLQRVPDEISQATGIIERSMIPPSFAAAPDATHEIVASTLPLTAREYEIDSNQHVNNCVYGDWLTEAATPPLSAWAARHNRADAQPQLRAIHLEYLRQTRAGEQVQVASQALHVQAASARAVIVRQQLVTTDARTQVLRATAKYLLLPDNHVRHTPNDAQ